MKAIIILLLLSMPLVAAAEKVLYLNLVVYEEGKAELNDTSVRYGKAEQQLTEGTHRIEMTDDNNNMLYTQYIGLSFVAYPIGLGQPIYVKKKHVYLRLPYSDAYERLRLFKGNELIFEAPIGDLLCNEDNICNGYENFLSCRDCSDGSKDGFCDRVLDGVCDGDCADDPDCILKQIDDKPVAKDSVSNRTDAVELPEPQKQNYLKCWALTAVAIIAILFILRIIQARLFRKD